MDQRTKYRDFRLRERNIVILLAYTTICIILIIILHQAGRLLYSWLNEKVHIVLRLQVSQNLTGQRLVYYVNFPINLQTSELNSTWLPKLNNDWIYQATMGDDAECFLVPKILTFKATLHVQPLLSKWDFHNKDWPITLILKIRIAGAPKCMLVILFYFWQEQYRKLSKLYHILAQVIASHQSSSIS